MVHPPVSLYLCIKRFPREIRKKVRKLLYHSLRTNVAEDEGFEFLFFHSFGSILLFTLQSFYFQRFT